MIRLAVLVCTGGVSRHAHASNSRKDSESRFSTFMACRPLAHIGARGIDQMAKRCFIQLAAGFYIHMPHAFATSLQQTSGILERRAAEETDVDVTPERVDVRERRVHDTCNRAAVVHQLPDVVTALSHPLKPLPRD